MDDISRNQDFDKWGGLLHFGAGRKRLIVAVCALSIMVIVLVIVIKFAPESTVRTINWIFDLK